MDAGNGNGGGGFARTERNTDFPKMGFGYNSTSPKDGDEDRLLTEPENCYSKAYDLVLNGYELLSGSIRIHDQEWQAKVFEAIGLTQEQAHNKFGFFLEAFKYGTPPHAGIAFGMDRLIMILAGTTNIKDVIAFPKNQSAVCPMTNAPAVAEEGQLKELSIKVEIEDKE